MIGYFDTSALVLLLIAEPASAVCWRLGDDSDAVVTPRLSYAEEQLDEDDLVVAAGDQKLLDACRSLGMATADVTDP